MHGQLRAHRVETFVLPSNLTIYLKSTSYGYSTRYNTITGSSCSDAEKAVSPVVSGNGCAEALYTTRMISDITVLK